MDQFILMDITLWVLKSKREEKVKALMFHLKIERKKNLMIGHNENSFLNFDCI